MGKEISKKMCATILVIAMISGTFAGFTAIAWGPGASSEKVADVEMLSSGFFDSGFNGKQPLNENALNRNSLSFKDDGPETMSPGPGNEAKGLWTYDFDADTVDQWPAIPPWGYGDVPVGIDSFFGPDDFEDDIVGNNPDLPPWRTVDGLSITEYWAEDFEGFAPSQDLTGGVISGDQGYFGNFVAPSTLTAEAPPAGAPPGTIIPGYTTGGLCAYFTDPTGGSYWGPAGVGDAPTTAYAGGWVYMNALARFDILLYDLAIGDVFAEVAFQNDGNIYHWPGGAYTQIAGITYTVGTWHEVYVQYDEVAATYSVWYDGVQYVAGSAPAGAAVNVDSLIWFGDVGSDAYVDNFFHFDPPAGLTHVVDVSNAQAHSGAQSVWIDQNGEAAPDLATTTATFDPVLAGTNGYWEYWLMTDATAGDTNGALAELIDQTGGGVIQLRANAGNFEYNDGGSWTNAVAFAPATWYLFQIYFDTVAKTFTLNINAAPSGGGAFARESGTLAGVRYGGTGGTQSEHYIDDVNVTCNGADANISVSNQISHSAPNALRFQEYGAGTEGYIAGDNFTGAGAVGNFSFWFYNTDNGGGQEWWMDQANGGPTLTIISLGINLATLEPMPGMIQFVNNDGAGLWVVDGPAYSQNTWHQIAIDYDCMDFGVSGSTGSYYYSFDGGAQVGPFGMTGNAQYFNMLTCFGGADNLANGDFFYDDFNLDVNAMPGPPTNCWAEIPQPTGAEVFGNYTTDQDNPDHGAVTGTEANTHGAGTEDIREVPIGDVPTWTNYSTNQDNPDHGTVTGTEANTHGAGTQDIQEVVPGGTTFTNYSTDMDIPVEGTVTGTEANTHGAGTEDIQEVRNGGDIFINYTVDQDIPVAGTVTNDYTYCGFPADGSTENIQEVVGAGGTTTINSNDFATYPGTNWAELDTTGNWDSAATANAGGTAPEARFSWTPSSVGLWRLYGGPFDTSSYTALDFSWDNFFNDYAAGVTVKIQTSSDAVTWQDTTWVVNSGGGDVGPGPQTIGITTSDLGSATFYISFTVEGDSYQLDYWYVDNALLTGDLPAGYYLEHRWRTEAIAAGADNLDLYVTARHTAGADDSFVIGYAAAAGGPYTPVITVNSNVMQMYSAPLPNTLSGQIYLNVIDSVTGEPAPQDTVFIDAIRIQYYVNVPYWYSLEHIWRTQAIIPGSNLLTLYVDAATTAGSDDTFSIGYSAVQAGPYTSVITVNSDVMQTYSAVLPNTLSGQIYINVIDDNDADPINMDSVIVDNIRVEGVVGGSLEHRWRLDPIDLNANSLTLYVTARASAGADDSFTFGYSSNVAGPYYPLALTVNSDIMQVYSVSLPIMNLMYLSVIDTNLSDFAMLDSIIIDTIRVEASIPSGTISNQYATADNPIYGTVTGTFALTTSTPPDGSAQQIDEEWLGSKGASDEPIEMAPGPQPTPRAILFTEGFEGLATGDPPAAPWTLIDQDGDGNNWYNIDDADGTPMPAHNGTCSITSASWNGAPLTPDNLMVTPQIDLSTYINGELLWWDAAQDPAYPAEHYEVWVSTTGNNFADFTDLVYEDTLVDDTWRMRTVDLSAYNGQQIYIAFRHNEVTDMFRMKLDDIQISADLAGWKADHVWTMQPQPAGSTTRTAFVTARRNVGADDDFTFGWSQNVAGPWTPMFTVDSTVWQTYSAAIPTGFTGPLYIKAWDTNGGDMVQGDTLWIDEIRVYNDDSVLPEYSLEHRWRTEVIPVGAATLDLYVDARTNTGTDDDFQIGYSTVLAGPYTPVITVNSDVMQTYSASLPYQLSGALYLNVIDTASDWAMQVDTVYVDNIRIAYYSPGGAMVQDVALMDIPEHGIITGTYGLTHSIPPDANRERIEEIDLSTLSPVNPSPISLSGEGPGITLNEVRDVLQSPGQPKTLVEWSLDKASEPADRVTMTSKGIAPEPLSPRPGSQPRAQVYYTDRATFDIDAPGLPIEDFEESTVGPGALEVMTGPLDEFTNNAFFAPGDILPGIQIQDNPGPDADGLVILGGGFAGEPDKTVATNTFADSIDMIFPNNDVHAVGMDLQSFVNPTTFDINIYTTGDVLLATTTAPATNAGSFWGVVSDEVIYRINLFSATETDGADNIAFGDAAPSGYSLEHRWMFDLTPNALTRTVFVNANTNAGSNDNFTFGWATNVNGPYTPMFNVSSDIPTTYSASIPVNSSGEFYVNVIDTNEDENTTFDSIFVDMMYVDSFISLGSTSVDLHWDLSLDDWGGTVGNNYTANQDNPVQGTVSGTFNDVGFPPDATTQDIQEILTGGDTWLNFSTDTDFPIEGNVAGTEVNTHVLDATTENIQEVLVPGGATVGILPLQDFEGAWPPAGWTVNNYGSAFDWNTNTFWGNTNQADPSSATCADADSDASGGGMDTGLRTPNFSLVGGYTDVFLDFDHNMNDITTPGGDFGEVRVSTNGGGTWDPAIATYDADLTGHVQLSLNAYIGQATVMVEFHYVDAGWDWWWMVDNIEVTGQMPAYSLEHHWRTQNISIGASSLDLYVTARTNGGADDTFTFGYATAEAGPYTPVITVNSAVMTTYSVPLSAALAGQILYIGVVDDTQTDGAQQDTVFVDEIRIQHYAALAIHHSLEHVWRTENAPPPVASMTLYVTARTNTGADDAFRFGYSPVVGGPFMPTSLSVNSDIMQTYSASLPTSLSGQFYLNVFDMNSVDAAQMDTIYIDAIRIEYQGFVTGAGENDIVQYNVYRADEEDGDTFAGPYSYIGSSPAGTDIYNDWGEGLDLVNQAWYYVEAEDVSGQASASGFFSKLNFPPQTNNTMADGVSPRYIISPFTPSVLITADTYDDSSQYEAIPRFVYAEMFVDVDPGEGAGTPMLPSDGLWGPTVIEQVEGTLDTSTWNVGVYEVWVRTAEDHGGTMVYGLPFNVTIEVIDGPPIADAGPDQVVPQHTLVTFDGSFSTDDVGITNYWWNFTDGVPVTLTTVGPTYTFDNEGVYNVTLTVMDTIGQTGWDVMTVTVTDGDAPVADAGPDQVDVPGAIINFDGSASYDPGHLGEPIDDGIVNWTWDFVDGVPQQYFGPTPSHQFNTPGVYPVTLTVTDQVGLTDTDEINVTIYQIFDIDVSQAAASDDWILVSFPNQVEGDPLTLIQDLGGDTTWDIAQWYDPTDPQPWKTTATFKPASLNDFTYVNNTMAFWIHITAYGDGMIRMVGDLASSGEMAVFNLRAGWNLVGYPFPIGQPSMNTFGTSFSIDDAMTYDPADPYRLRAYIWYVGENHDPGQGYWIHCLGDEDLFIWAP